MAQQKTPEELEAERQNQIRLAERGGNPISELGIDERSGLQRGVDAFNASGANPLFASRLAPEDTDLGRRQRARATTVPGPMTGLKGTLGALERSGAISPGDPPPANAAEGTAQQGEKPYQPEGSPLDPRGPGYGAGGAAPATIISHPKQTQETHELGHDVTKAREHYKNAADALSQAAELEQTATETQSKQEQAFFDAQLRNKQNLQNIQAGREAERQAEIKAFQGKIQAARDHAQSPQVVLGNALGEMLGGIGVAMGAWAATRTKGPNHAMQLYNSLAERRLAKMKQESADTENFFSRMKAQFGDERQAELATRLAIDDIAKVQLAKIGAMAKSDHAKAAVQEKIAGIEAQQAGWSIDAQKIEDGKKVQSTTINQDYVIGRDGARAVAMGGQEQSAFQRPQTMEERMTAGPSDQSVANWAKSHNDGVMPERPAEAPGGTAAAAPHGNDKGVPAVVKVGGKPMLVQPPGARVAMSSEAAAGAVDKDGNALQGRQLAVWRKLHARRGKNNESLESSDLGKLPYGKFVQNEHHKKMMKYMVQAPRIAQAVSGIDISDNLWAGWKLASKAGALGKKAFAAGLSDAERQSINRAETYARQYIVETGGKALSPAELENLEARLNGAGSFRDFKQILMEDYTAAAGTYNTMMSSLNNDGLVEMYEAADHGGAPVWAPTWGQLAVPAGKKR
jgi:hypothetical protein